MAMQRCWHLVDAKHQIVGRLAVQIANILKGKHKPTFENGRDMGDHVVVINAERVKFSSKKMKTKLYRYHTGYPGGLKEKTPERMMEKNPRFVLKHAVLGMLKRNRHRHRYTRKRLHIYAGPNHPHQSELPAAVQPLPRVPRALQGSFHFGLNTAYADPNSLLVGRHSKTNFFRKVLEQQKKSPLNTK